MGQIKKIDLVCDLIYQASKISKKSFRSLEKKDISSKEGFDLVTKVDRDSEFFLKEGLYQIDNKAGFLGEESGKQDSLDSDKIWIVDPIDGTRNFVQGLPFFSISVALASKDLKKIYLEVSKNNSEGIAFYTRMKFKTIYTRKNYLLINKKRIDALAMSKTY